MYVFEQRPYGALVAGVESGTYQFDPLHPLDRKELQALLARVVDDPGVVVEIISLLDDYIEDLHPDLTINAGSPLAAPKIAPCAKTLVFKDERGVVRSMSGRYTEMLNAVCNAGVEKIFCEQHENIFINFTATHRMFVANGTVRGGGFVSFACASLEDARAACALMTNASNIVDVVMLRSVPPTARVSETEFSLYASQQFANGAWDHAAAAVRMYRYGNMTPAQFHAEMQERIEMVKAEQAEAA